MNDSIKDDKKYNEEDTINPKRKLELNSNIKPKIKEKKENIQFNNEPESDNTKCSSDASKEQTNKNGQKQIHLFNAYEKKTHDIYENGNKIKKGNAFLINKVCIAYGNKILKICQDGKENPDILFKINDSQITNTKVDFTKKLLNKSIKEILSDSVSHTQCHDENHNKDIIEKYYNKYDMVNRFFGSKYIEIINYINKQDNTFVGLLDTYKEELQKRNDINFMENLIKDFVGLIEKRKSK